MRQFLYIATAGLAIAIWPIILLRLWLVRQGSDPAWSGLWFWLFAEVLLVSAAVKLEPDRYGERRCPVCSRKTSARRES